MRTAVFTYPQLPNHQTIPPVDEIQLACRQLLDPAPEANLAPSFLASVTEKIGWKAVVVQPQTTDVKQVVKDILKHSPDIVGFSSLSMHVPGVKLLSEKIKSKNPEIVTIVGGYHATFRPIDFVEMQSIDFVFKGTNLEKFQEFLKEFEQKNILRKNKIINPGWQSIDRLNLDLIISPLPYDERIFSKKWQSQNFGIYPDGGYASIKESSGCPMKCAFCEVQNYYGSKVVVKSTQLVMEEVKKFWDNGIKTIFFEGENFYGLWAKKLLQELERELEHSDIKMKFAAETMALAITPEFVEQLSNGGIIKIAIGVESPDYADREYLNKPGAKSKLDFFKSFKLLEKQGILGWGFRMTGLPTYSLNDLKRNEEFAKNYPFHEMRLTCFTPMPGTPIWKNWNYKKMPIEINEINDWSKFDTTRLVFKHPNLTEIDIWKSIWNEYNNFVSGNAYQKNKEILIGKSKKENQEWMEKGFEKYKNGVMKRLDFLDKKLSLS